MKKILTVLTLFLCTLSMGAQTPLAGATQENPVAINMGECYLFPTDFSNAYFTFKAETDGVLYLTLSKALKIFGQDGPIPLFGKECVLGVRAGETYTFYNTTTWGDSITMTPSFVEGKPYLQVAVVSASPADGSTYRTTNQEGNVTFAFNVGIDVTAVKAELELPDGEIVELSNYRSSEDYNTQGTNYVVLLAETYNALVDAGKLKPGDKFKVSLSDIVSEKDAENRYEGKASVQLTASEEVVKLVSVSNREKLQSYYMPGDEAGLITLTFTAPVTCTASNATLVYGDREAGTWKEVKVPYTVEGNTIIWNVQGIHLSDVPADDEGNRYVSISLRNICDKDGYPVESNAIGTTGTILFSYLVETMDINIYPDFLPAAGGNIDAVGEIEIWISAGKYVTFDGARVTYQSNGESAVQVIPLEQLRQEDDPYSETDLLVYVPIAGIPFEAGEVIVELTGVSAANGTSPEIKVTYVSAREGSSGVRTSLVSRPSVVCTYLLDGTPLVGNALRKGVYLQKMTDGSVRKVIIRN